MMLEKIQFIEALTPTYDMTHLRHTIVHRHVITSKCTSKVSFYYAILGMMLEKYNYFIKTYI